MSITLDTHIWPTDFWIRTISRVVSS